MSVLNIVLMGGEGAEQGGGMMNIAMLVMIFVVFYFFMIRPQMKKAKDQKKYRESIAKGDKVVTIAGIHGKIVEMDETTVVLEMIDGARIKMEKSAISMESTMAIADKKA